MENNNFTCLSYDTIDFLIQSKYILFGIYLHSEIKEQHTIFENELLPHINLGHYLEEKFMCKSQEECNVMLVLRKDDFDQEIQKQIEEFTGTKLPVSGNFALSVNTCVTSKIMDTSSLRLVPNGIREELNNCGITALGFLDEFINRKNQRREILISPDNLLKKLIRG